MKKVNITVWAFLIILLAFVGCRKDIDDDTKKTTDYPINLVKSNVSGIVSTELGDPISGAIVQLNNKTVTTNEFGIFSFTNESLNEYGQKISISKSGYFEINKVFTPSLNTTSYLSIQLMEKNLTGKFHSGTGSSITTSDGATVQFEANEIMMADGSSYNGEVNVYVRWLNPKASNIYNIMPGDLRGTDKNLKQVQLSNYGMMVVEMESPSGEKLQIKEGELAKLTFPLPGEIQGIAPDEISLSSFDEDSGYWIEESTAKLENGHYVGEVPHFSFWDCNGPHNYVHLEGKIIDSNGSPLFWIGVSMESDTAGVGHGYTNSEGIFEGLIPAGGTLNLHIHNNCGEFVYEQEIGPFTDDAVLDDIVLDVSNNLVLFTGTLVDCNGEGIQNGIVLFNNGNFTKFIQASDNGTFAHSKLVCSEQNGSIKAYDNGASLSSDIIDFTVPMGAMNYNFDDIEVCEEIEEYIKVNTDSPYEYEFNEYSINFWNNSLSIQAVSILTDTTNLQINSLVGKDETGTFELSTFYVEDNVEKMRLDCGGNWNSNPIECPDINITLNEGSGGYIEGNFNGEFLETNFNGNSTIINGSVEFRLLLK